MESENKIPQEVAERVKKENEETVNVYELKNQYYQMLNGMLPIVDKIMNFFSTDSILPEDTVKDLVKNAVEVAKYLENCIFRKEFFSENYQKLICNLKEEGNSAKWQQDMKEMLLHMRENMVLAIQQAEKQRYTCCCCKQRNFFLPFTKYYDYMQEYYGGIPWKHETQNSENMVCPACGSFDRERLIVLALQREELKQKRILQIAPSNAIDNFLKSQENAGYDTCDLFMEGVTFKADLQHMDMVEKESYDIWICSHVLEHVKDDKKAMEELYRITKKGGYGLVLVPIDLNQKETEEEWGRPEEECWRRFGQDDHTRKYAKHDFIKRLELAGFEVEELNRDIFGEEVFQMNALSDTSVLYKAKR